MNYEKLKDLLDESEINVFEMNLNAAIEILENKEKDIRNTVDC